MASNIEITDLAETLARAWDHADLEAGEMRTATVDDVIEEIARSLGLSENFLQAAGHEGSLSRKAWQAEVADGCTLRGYDDWVSAKIEELLL